MLERGKDTAGPSYRSWDWKAPRGTNHLATPHWEPYVALQWMDYFKKQKLKKIVFTFLMYYPMNEEFLLHLPLKVKPDIETG